MEGKWNLKLSMKKYTTQLNEIYKLIYFFFSLYLVFNVKKQV